MCESSITYQQEVRSRSEWHYLKGLLIRWWQDLRYRYIRRVARRRGAVVGKGVVMPMSLARIANSNLTIGDHVSIQTSQIDLRNPVHIGSHVIIGSGTQILTTSHVIDDPAFRVKNYGITIEDFVWLPTHVLVLPSCRHIGRGAVAGSGSVLAHDVAPMTVVSGNPATVLRQRHNVHSELVVESLLGGDYEAYRAARKQGGLKNPV